MFIINIIGVIVMVYCGNVIVTGISESINETIDAKESMRREREKAEEEWKERLGL